MEHVGNIRMVSPEFTWQDSAGLTTLELSKMVGSQAIYVNLDTVPKGAYSTKYHSHSTQEEFFYVLAGSGILLLNGEESIVSQGDFLGKPAGQGIAHTFFNPNEEPLLILDCGNAVTEDTCYYPNEDVYLNKSNGKAHAYRIDGTLPNWDSNPNQKG